MRYLIGGLLGTALLFEPSLSSATTFIRCKSDSYSEITISMDATKKLGRIVNCINGNFITDMTPCAPAGGFGLSAPTGSVGLVGIVDRWQDYKDHLGGVASSVVSDTQITFTGGFMGFDDFTLNWTFSVDRITGEGELVLNDDRGEGSSQKYAFSCLRKDQVR